MKKTTIFLFGESEKGEYGQPIICSSLIQLFESVGDAPPDSQGIHFAIQFLSIQREILFFRIREEGFSSEGYFEGFKWLEKKTPPHPLAAICLPGVGDHSLIDKAIPLCQNHKALIILSEKDLQDYLYISSAK